MNSNIYILLIISLLFTSCGDTSSKTSSSPRQPKDTTKMIHSVNNNETDWTWFVGTDVEYKTPNLTLDTYFMHGLPPQIGHLQYFLDTDNNPNTGFSTGQDSWRVSGADFLIEDGDVYQSMSTVNWSWEYIGKFDKYTKSVEGNITKLHIDTNNSTISSMIKSNTIHVTIEPFNDDWSSTYSTISTQTVKFQDKNIDKIHKAFDEHTNYFKKEIPRRLPHTSYVLYDVQTFLQNSAIYADEKSDTYMLTKLLQLVKMPLEQTYLTNREWVEKEDAAQYNGNTSYKGREVELCVSQYFSLLTRVLSACERHNIPTNLSANNKAIIEEHINKWNNNWLQNWQKRDNPEYQHKNIHIKYDDREGFFVMSVLQYHDYLQHTNRQKATQLFDSYNNFITIYMEGKANIAWSSEMITIDGENHNLAYFAKDNTENYYVSLPNEHAWSAYGSEIKDKSSDTDPMAMFYADGSIKQPAKQPTTYSDDISHGRRYIWFFESIKRLGEPFNIAIDEEKFKGFANTLAYRVCRGTVDDPHFTIYVDGVDGWYRVGYAGRKHYGYTVGEMDGSFVSSSYGMMGIYNPKIYTWMDAWVNKKPSRLDGYHGAYRLEYLTSKAINLKQELAQ